MPSTEKLRPVGLVLTVTVTIAGVGVGVDVGVGVCATAEGLPSMIRPHAAAAKHAITMGRIIPSIKAWRSCLTGSPRLQEDKSVSYAFFPKHQWIFVSKLLCFYGNCSTEFSEVAQKDLRIFASPRVYYLLRELQCEVPENCAERSTNFAVYPVELHFQCLICGGKHCGRRTSCEFSREITLQRPFPCLPNQYFFPRR